MGRGTPSLVSADVFNTVIGLEKTRSNLNWLLFHLRLQWRACFPRGCERAGRQVAVYDVLWRGRRCSPAQLTPDPR